MTVTEKIYDIFSGGKVSYKNEIIKTRNENLQLINDFIAIANKDYPELKGNTWWLMQQYHLKEVLFQEPKFYNRMIWDELYSVNALISNNTKDIMKTLVRLQEEIKTNAKIIKKNKEVFDSEDKPIYDFFVLSRIGLKDDNLYCYSNDLKYDEDTSSLNGIVYASKNDSWTLYRTINYNEYSIREMTSEEFESNFLPERLRICEIKSEIEGNIYTSQMRELFYKYKKLMFD
jgi:hypothetical protein